MKALLTLTTSLAFAQVDSTQVNNQTNETMEKAEEQAVQKRRTIIAITMFVVLNAIFIYPSLKK